MLSDTLTEGLKQYEIGAKIRALRQEKRLGQVQLGEHTGLSPALLSKIERGQLFPTLPTLLRIAMVFGVGLDHFFVDSTKRPSIAVTRGGERIRLPDRADDAPPTYTFESLNFPMNDRTIDAYYAEFPASSPPSAPHQHGTSEFVYLLKGRLAIEIDGETVTLAPGDAVHFDSRAPHVYACQGKADTAAIVVIIP
ncbi:MAG: helix-turn-helix domain-containing protein [Acetobacteraceae bacterium]